MTTTIPADLAQYCDASDARARDELFAFLRIPSVSARSEHKADCAEAARFVADALTRIGFTTTIESTPGHPIVVGEWRNAPAGAPTLLIYGHYDVQPAEPLELWTSPPFEPEVRDGRIYARGSVDDKGQLYLHVKALEAHLATRGTLPVNVIVLAEGEEEVGSANLEAFLEREKDRLAFATMHDADGRIAIPGFYDQVRPFPDHVRAQMRELPFSDDQLMHEVGVTALGGEPGYTTLERLWTRPTCEVNGLLSGYTGEGAKTVLPAVSMAKVSFRLVPDQDPQVIAELVQQHVARVAPAGVTVTVENLHGGRPWRADLQGPIIDAGKAALTAAFGREPVITGEGGSIPVVGDFERILGAPVLLMGFGVTAL